MRILIYTRAFSPSRGGIETLAETLAWEMADAGHQVRLVTATRGPSETLIFEVARRPGPIRLLRLVAWSEVVFQISVSLRGVWPLLLIRRPLVVNHNGLYRRAGGQQVWRDRLKVWVAGKARGSIAVSQFVADRLGVSSTVVPNPFRDGLFVSLSVPRERDLIYVGRLVSEKGVDLVLRSLASMASQGVRPRFTVVGEGPEEVRLKELAAALDLNAQVDFIGPKSGPELVRLLNMHQIMIVPSVGDEAFGIAALEGIACGCVVVGAAAGGLPEAIGPCGVIFPKGDSAALATLLGQVLAEPGKYVPPEEVRRTHLESHRAREIAQRYLAVLQAAVERREWRR